MKRRIVVLLLILAVVVSALAGCKIQTPDEAAAQAAQKSMATQTADASEAPSVSPTPSQSATTEGDSYDVANAGDHGNQISDGEYQKYLNEANTRTADPNASKDEYGTGSVPEGMPRPVEWQDATINKNAARACTLYIECSAILNNMDQFDMDKIDVLPQDGVIYSAKKVTFYEGESVFDVLLRETQKNRIHMEYSMTPGYNSNYIKGIGNLYEHDCGELSGWMYSVNGWFPNYGCSRYQLKDGDVIELHYTCDLGRDLGVTWVQ